MTMSLTTRAKSVVCWATAAVALAACGNQLKTAVGPGPAKPLSPATEPPPHPTPPATDCPLIRNVVDIRAGGDAVAQGLNLKRALETENTTVRLGPDVDLDLSKLPVTAFPLFFARCVTLTSVASFEQTTPAPETVARKRDGSVVPEHISSTPTPEARSPQKAGPVLRLKTHRDGITDVLAVRTFPGSTLNDHVRISGFRLYGPRFDNQTTSEVGIHVNRSIDVEITNMEIAGWSEQAVKVDDSLDEAPMSEGASPGRITSPAQVRIHGNFVHHNQHATEDRHAAGYGVSVGQGGWAKIYENAFDFNRHAIEADGRSGGYEAEHNLVLKGGGHHDGFANEYTHIFDVHGTGCAGFQCGDAGVQFWYRGNAFQYTKDHAIKIRGKPAFDVFFANNVFVHSGLSGDAIELFTSENSTLGVGNVTGFDSFGQYGVCDFDGDGVDDLFLPTGVTWWLSSFADMPWSFLNTKPERLSALRFGYFDGDQRCDVLTEHSDGGWYISSGGTSDWQLFGKFGVPLAEVRFGRFNPSERDHRTNTTLRTTHAFRRPANSGQWSVTSLQAPDWHNVQSSEAPLKDLGFGDFNGDGVTDVLGIDRGHWAVSDSATGTWRQLNARLGDPIAGLFIANMDADDNIDDILRVELKRGFSRSNYNGELIWWRSKNGTGPWEKWSSLEFDFVVTPDTVLPGKAFAGRFGVAPGGGTMFIDEKRIGHFFSAAENAVGSQPNWQSTFAY